MGLHVNPLYAEDVDMALDLTANQYRPPELVDMIKNTNRVFMDTIGVYSRSLVSAAKKLNNYFNNNPLIEKIKSRLTQSDVILSDTAIHRINPVNIYNPSLTMKRYIMANPRAYTLYRKERINGYDDIWLNQERNIDPKWRDDYIDVVDEVMQYDKDNDEGYTDHYVGRENKLTFMEQIVVKEAWDVFNRLIDEDLDPTDIENYNKGD